MGGQWMLWMLVLTFSSRVEAQADTTGKTSGDETYQQVELPYPCVRGATPYCCLLSTNATEQQREPLPSVSKMENKTCNSETYLTSSAEVSCEAKSTSTRKMDLNTKLLEVLEKQNTKNESVLLINAASPRQMIGGEDMQELKKSDLMLAYDAGYNQQTKCQDALLLNISPEVVQINATEDLVKRTSECCMCLGYPCLLDNHDRLHTYTINNNISWNNYGSLVDQDLTLVGLVRYLIGLTYGRQFYLVYDDVMPGVVRAFQEVLGDTILLPYDPSILMLTEVLTSNYHVQAVRNVFVFCSPTHVAHLFEQVRKKVLESTTIQWFVIVDKDLTKDLPLLLREGTQVALVQRVTSQKAQLFSSRVDPDGYIRFHQVGSWSVSGIWRSNSHLVKGGLIPDLQQLYSDFHGRQLMVTTNNNWPFFKIKTLENGTVIPISGIDLSLINTLSEKLNFTYRLIRPPDGKWGSLRPDNTFSGLVGQVARHEAHAALCELAITATRETVVDFTMPYFMESTVIVSPAPKEKNRSFVIFSTFTLEVWLCICLATMLVGPLLYMVTRLLLVYLGEEDSVHYSLQSFTFNMYRNLMVQGNLITSHRWSLRFIFISWYLFSLYINALYSGTLTAVFAVTSFEKPIDSLYHLAKARRDGYTIGTTRESSFADAFKSAKSGIYQTVWQLFSHENPDQSFQPDPDIGFETILRQRHVFINGRLNSELRAARMGRDKFYIGRQGFLPQACGIACSSGSPFKDVFNSILIRLREAGMVTTWTNNEVNRISKCTSPSSQPGPPAITLQHLQGAFIVALLGFTISAIVFVLEIMTSRLWQSIKTLSMEKVVIQVEDHPSQSGEPAGGPRLSKIYFGV